MASSNFQFYCSIGSTKKKPITKKLSDNYGDFIFILSWLIHNSSISAFICNSLHTISDFVLKYFHLKIPFDDFAVVLLAGDNIYQKITKRLHTRLTSSSYYYYLIDSEGLWICRRTEPLLLFAVPLGFSRAWNDILYSICYRKAEKYSYKWEELSLVSAITTLGCEGLSRRPSWRPIVSADSVLLHTGGHGMGFELNL